MIVEVFFGFILGWLFLRLISLDLWYISMIIAMYPLMDISLTIFFKILKGHKPWKGYLIIFFTRRKKKTDTYFNFNLF